MEQASLLVLVLCLVTVEVMGQTSLSQSDKQAILDAHNRHRGMVNPSASNMEVMIWSDELAQVAQKYAEQCVFDHNPNRQSQQSTFTSVGENIAADSGPANYVGFVQSWYNEVSDYDLASNSCGGTCGHYTQVVWAASTSLGCGAFRCPQLQNVNFNGVIFVCNYGPAGNFVGRSPYISGTSCSGCGTSLPFCVSNLCSAQRSLPVVSNGDCSSVMLSQSLMVAAIITQAMVLFL